MLDFLIGNIFVTFGGAIFQQKVGIPMGTNCADLFLYSYETEFLQNLVKNKNFTLLTPLTLHTDILMIYCPSTILLLVHGYHQ